VKYFCPPRPSRRSCTLGMGCLWWIIGIIRNFLKKKEKRKKKKKKEKYCKNKIKEKPYDTLSACKKYHMINNKTKQNKKYRNFV
jgi:hypothetical protein